MANISDLQLLVTLAEEANMRKASERLFVSQPALSQRLRNIEKHWGTSLFIRTQKGLILTPPGELVVRFARDVLDQQNQVQADLHELESKVYGTLKIACASIVGLNWLPKVLKEFVTVYPQVEISLITGWSSEISKSLYDGDAHIGIIRGATDWKGKKIHLFEDPLYLVDHEISTIEEVMETERSFIQFKSDSNYNEEIRTWWHKQFQTFPKRTIVVDQIETCKQMTYNGIGYAILPEITLSDIQKDLFKIPLKDEKNQAIKRDTWMLGYDASFELGQVKAFVEIVQKYIQNDAKEID